MKIVVFEDDKFDLLYPLSMLRAVYDVKPGASSILEKISAASGKTAGSISLHCRKSLAPLMKSQTDLPVNEFGKDDYLLLNGRFVFDKKFINKLLKSKPDDNYFISGSSVAYATVSKAKSVFLNGNSINDEGTFSREFFEYSGLGMQNIEAKNFKELIYPWNVVAHLLSGGLTEDLDSIGIKGKTSSGKNFVKARNIHASAKSRISRTAVLDATEGKIIIEQGCEIEPFVFIKGPAYIGKNSLIKSGAKIYGPCVIGEGSKVAGEMAESVFHSHVNKQHDGFVGHSYFCPFVNLGADTVTSDLKNNYSNIRQNFKGGNIDTGMRFLGSILGDHTKTSINTMLNTGTIAGIFANIFGGGFPSKNIRSFSWNEAGKTSEKYDFDKAIETAKIVMSRRGIDTSDEYVELTRKYFDNDSEST
ncbi:MAG: hypothetical protein IPG99_14210 [Ignavibacteria bacterium]|nr:hypothetical protein [Ignavibacteria bacterium]